MKKFIVMAMLTIGTTVFADDYKYLTVGYNSTEKSIELTTIQKITFENNQMVVATSDGEQTFPQAQLEKMFFSQTATGVKEVQSSEPKVQGSVLYDLTGRRVEKASKGIYIVDGRKIVIK